MSDVLTDARLEGATWYHLSDGFMFAKLPGGQVAIACKPGFDAAPNHYTICGPSEWASVVAHVSTLGETAKQHGRAYMLHRRGFEDPPEVKT